MDTIHIDVHGKGPAVVLIHGAPSLPRHFDGLVAALATDHRVLVPHLPGYGRTPPSSADWTLARTDALLGSSLRTAGVMEAHIVGFSAGALRALTLALSGTVRPKSVVLLSGLCNLWPEERAGFRRFAAALRAGADLTPVAETHFLSEGFARSHPEAAAEARTWLTDVDRTSLARELDALANEQPDLTPRLFALDCPLLARAGRLDVAVPLAHAEAMVAATPDAVLQSVDGVGHALLLEDFEATLSALREHLARDG